MERKQEAEFMRKEYMAERMTHAEYYEWLGTFINFTPRMLQIPLDEIRKSTDPHLNDIPLAKWDSHYNLIVRLGQGIPFSKSDAVCIAKVMARKWIREELNGSSISCL